MNPEISYRVTIERLLDGIPQETHTSKSRVHGVDDPSIALGIGVMKSLIAMSNDDEPDTCTALAYAIKRCHIEDGCIPDLKLVAEKYLEWYNSGPMDGEWADFKKACLPPTAP